MDLIEVTYVEIDVKYCSLSYGVGPCTAELGVTGSQKCFNTRNFTCDCQDPQNYDETSLTVRFGIDNGHLPYDIPCIPSLLKAPMEEADIAPGVSLGDRATLTCSFKNHPHGDAGLDKYISDRTYNPFLQGTFWGKWRARNPYMHNQPIRLRRGYVGQSLSEFRTDHFVIGMFEGPNENGQVTVKGYDFMRLLSGKQSQAPAVSQGYLNTDYSAGATSITLSPTGIGDSYPASGVVAVGEEEISYTRSGDVLSGFTTEQDHSEGDLAQEVLVYESKTSAYIINDLITNYTPLDSSYTDFAQWNALAQTYGDTLYGARIVRPTAVEKLVNELIEQAGLVVYGDTQRKKVFYDILRANIPTGQPLTGRQVVAGSFKQADQPDLRYSQVWVFYSQRDVFKNLDEPSNFYSVLVKTPGENLYTTQSIKKIYSRWIPQGAQSVASDVGGRALARYINPPRKFAFSIFALSPFKPSLGQTVPLEVNTLEDCFGAQASVPAVITGVRVEGEGNAYRAEELKFDAEVTDIARVILIDGDAYNVNLRDRYDAIYATIEGSTAIEFRIVQGVVVGSVSNTLYSLRTGVWPSGVQPTLVVESSAFLVGRGGDGVAGADGQDGGAALLVESPFAVNNLGVIGGGGGAGGGYFRGGRLPATFRGGGGAGRDAGAGPGPGVTAAIETGAEGYDDPSGSYTGDGGDLGQAGTDASVVAPDVSTAYSGGAAGVAVQGDSLVSWTNEGDIRGSRVG